MYEAKNIIIETKEDEHDLVTEYDRKLEEILIFKIKEKYPHHKYINEKDIVIKYHLNCF